MKFNNLKIFLSFLIFISTSLSAQVSQTYQRGNLTIEPVIGYERVQRLEPVARTENRFYYGVRGHYGPDLLSLEAEITQSRDDDSFPDDDLRIKETSTTGMLGLRSSFARGRLFNWYLRAGGHARKVEITRIEAGIEREIDPAVRVSPYAGTGLNLNIHEHFKLDAGVTVVFTGHPQGSDREYRTSLGFSFKL